MDWRVDLCLASSAPEAQGSGSVQLHFGPLQAGAAPAAHGAEVAVAGGGTLTVAVSETLFPVLLYELKARA